MVTREGPATYLGIDVGKAQLDVAEEPSGRCWRVPNTEEGWQALVTDLAGAPAPLIVLEASGGYEVGVVVALDAAGLTPVVVNPVATRRFAQSVGTRAKTDRIDAALLARYAARMCPTPRPLPAETARTLQALLTRRRQLTKLLVAEQNHAKRAVPLVRPQITALCALLTAQRAEVDQLLASVVAGDPDWQARVDRLDTVPGIGPVTATILAVGLPELGRCTDKQAAALLGIAPDPRESGQFRGQRHISAGRGTVRHALYEAVTTTVRCEPTFRAHYRQLRARGKAHKQAMVACMRRLIGILTAMLRDGLTWQQTKVGQGQFLPPST